MTGDRVFQDVFKLKRPLEWPQIQLIGVLLKGGNLDTQRDSRGASAQRKDHASALTRQNGCFYLALDAPKGVAQQPGFPR